MLRALIAFAVSAVFAASAPALAQNRHALVIGIDDYAAVPKLERAVADARAMAKALDELGFRVRLVENPDRSGFSAAFGNFREGIEAGDTAFVFFAGHGMEIDGQNLLLARDAPNPNEASQDQVRDAGFTTASLIDRVTRQGARAALFVFDACRNNPYASRTRGRSIGATRGLARQDAPEGVFVLMSAGQGQEALDSLNLRGRPATDTDANSIFTRVLVDELRKPGLSHIELAKSVQLRVRDLARGADHVQLPAFYDQIVGNVVFRPAEGRLQPPVAAGPAPAVVAPALPAPPPGPTADEATWSFIKDTTQAAQLEQFLARFPQSAHRREAEARLAELRRIASAPPAAPPPAVPPLPPPTAAAPPAAAPPPPANPPAPAPTGLARPRLGVGVAELNDDTAKATGGVKGRGVLVSHIEPGSLAEKVGLLTGDVILSFDGKEVSAPADLVRLVGEAAPDRDILIGISRAGRETRFRVTFASIDAPPAAPPPPAGPVFSPTRSAAPLAPTEERSLKPKDSFKECETCPEMVVVPAGNFLMGSPASELERSADEGPQRRIAIAKHFAVGKFEITFAEWDACVAEGGGCTAHDQPKDRGFGRGRRPLIGVSHWQARNYIEWLNGKVKVGAKYRLLTEAEWEYAARAGTTTPFAFGRTISTDDANYDGRRAYAGGRRGVWRKQTLPVGSFRPNAFGLYDMHGNVWEWVADCWVSGYEGRGDDAKAMDTGAECRDHVLRGGGYSADAEGVRSAWRYYRHTHHQEDSPGFRVARTLEQ